MKMDIDAFIDVLIWLHWKIAAAHMNTGPQFDAENDVLMYT